MKSFDKHLVSNVEEGGLRFPSQSDLEGEGPA